MVARESDVPATELIRALRQCDGEHVQRWCWCATTFGWRPLRFMRELEVPLVEGKNSAAVDLFDPRHAREDSDRSGPGLWRSTRRRLEHRSGNIRGTRRGGAGSRWQRGAGAAQPVCRNGKGATLGARDIAGGGRRGRRRRLLPGTDLYALRRLRPNIVVTKKRPAPYCNALLPNAKTDLKGHQRSQAELLEASGYAGRPNEFRELIRVLDAELRLITPTDPEEKDEGRRMKDEKDIALPSDSSFILHPSSFRYYQLSHDYLVHTLRQWLTRKQRETWQGRAELCLEERTQQWQARHERRYLPSPGEFLRIHSAVPAWRRTREQSTLLWAANRFYAACLFVFIVAVAGLTGGWLFIRSEWQSRRAGELVATLMHSETDQLPELLTEMDGLHGSVAPRLVQVLQDESSTPKQRLHASLALLPHDSGQVKYLKQRLLTAEPGELFVLRAKLSSHSRRAQPATLANRGGPQFRGKPAFQSCLRAGGIRTL